MQPLLASPREDVDPDELRLALSYASGGTFRHGVDLLTLSDEETDRSLRFTTGQVDYNFRPLSMTAGQTSGVTETRRRFTAALAGPVSENLFARRLRPWTDLLLPSNRWARFFHGVFEPQNPQVDDDGVVVRRTLVCLDKTGRWAKKALGTPVTVSGSEPIVAYVKARLTAVFGETSFAIPASAATLGQPRTFEASTSELEFLSKLLEGIAYDQLHTNELGQPASQPLSVLAGRGAEATYGPGRGKTLPTGQVSPLLPSLPNVLRFSARQGPSLGNVDGNGLTYRRNQSTGPASLTARGGYEVEETIDVDVDSQPALEVFADAERQTYFAGGGERFTGAVALNPLAGDRDVIELDKPRLGLSGGLWVVTSWSLPMNGAKSESDVVMPITAERKVAA